MPITSELQNTRELKAVGFTDQQAEKLAELLERSQQQGFERFSEVLQTELERLRTELRGEFQSGLKDLRIELHQSLRNQMVTFVSVLVAVVSLAVAIIKLFPNVG